MLPKIPVLLQFGALAALLLSSPFRPAAAQQDASAGPIPTFKTTVRRVVLDAVITDANGQPVHGLSQADFVIDEDGKPQQTLSFESHGFDNLMDYSPGKLPALPVNTFVNLPATPEKGPLYVLLYDLVNMDRGSSVNHIENENQIRARQQLAKFIQNKPEGARFAIFVWSDGLHLIQGFTSDKSQLYAAIDPHSSRPHIPEVFLMGENFGHGDIHSSIDVLNYIAGYLAGLPGRKNLIWFTGDFPLSFYFTRNDGPNYIARAKATLNLLAEAQIAIYPVNARGVVAPELGNNTGATNNSGSTPDNNGSSGASSSGGSQSSSPQDESDRDHHSMVGGGYADMDEIARETGGRAFYSNNQLAAELLAATENGANYYTLTYAPTDRTYDGKLRSIHLQLTKNQLIKAGYHLAYRRTYYASDTGEAAALAEDKSPTAIAPAAEQPQKQSDALFVNMKHGAPIAHQLVFAAHVHTVGPPAKGTEEQMALLATRPAYFKPSRSNTPAKPMRPIPLQKFAVDYTVSTHQLERESKGRPLQLQIAVAAFDGDGLMLNMAVNEAPDTEGTPQPAKIYRVEQQLDVPLAAASIRIAIRDANTDRVGAMEIKLPLAPENQTALAGDTKKASDKAN